MKFLALLLFFTLTLFLSNSQTLSKTNDLKDFLKDFAKDSESYLENITEKIREKIIHELLKFSFNDFLNSSLSTSPINITHVNFQSIMPFLNFLKKLNLTNHTKEELEQIIWEILPKDYNSTNIVALKANKEKWDAFIEDFLKKILNKFSTNNTNFFEHVTEKLKEFYKGGYNSSNYNLTHKINILGNLSNEVLNDKDAISDLAKNIHSQMKGEKSEEIKENNSYIGLFVMIILFVVIIGLVGFLIRRSYKKKQSEHYNQMESTQLNS